MKRATALEQCGVVKGYLIPSTILHFVTEDLDVLGIEVFGSSL